MTPPDGREEELFRELARRLKDRPTTVLGPDEAAGRAAVTLLLAGPGRTPELRTLRELGPPPEPRTPPEPGTRPPPERQTAGSGADAPTTLLPVRWRGAHALLILRTRVEGDPWAGHVALPGGKREDGDRDLLATALRETAEETGLVVARDDVLGRLSDLHPRSARLPDLAIRPFVARWRGRGDLSFNHEVDDGFWVPLAALADADRRSELVLDRAGGRRRFPTIELGPHTVWGLTHAIVREFLETLSGPEGAAG